jgi:hypothetical protein
MSLMMSLTVGGGGDAQTEIAFDLAADLVQEKDAVGIGDGDDQVFAVKGQRQHQVLADVIEAEQGEGPGIDGGALRLLERQAERLGQRRENLRLAGDVHGEEDFVDRLAGGLRGDGAGLDELIGGDMAALQEELLDGLALPLPRRLPEGRGFVGDAGGIVDRLDGVGDLAGPRVGRRWSGSSAAEDHVNIIGKTGRGLTTGDGGKRGHKHFHLPEMA